jgi:putative membrane protein
MTSTDAREKREPLILLGLGVAALVVSGISPLDRLTWVLEVFPAVAGALIFIFLYRRLRFTPLVYRLVLLHALVLILGGHYSYAKVPLGYWVQDALDLARNPYDRVGHFMQGFVPAVVAREVLLRKTPLRPGGWLSFLVVAVCLGFSAFYEFTEWWAALALGESADAFLGTQGDQWDTQWDMFMCFAGSVLSLVIFTRLHDRQLARAGASGGGNESGAV